MPKLDQLLSTAIDLAEISAELSTNAWAGDLVVDYKQDGSSLTKADLSIETRWREEIRARFPTHGVLGEEYGSDVGRSDFTWVLDPIDGTRQFGAGLLNFASLISVCRNGVPIVGIIDLPMPGARYIAAEGLGATLGGRRIRSSKRLDLSDAIVSLANPDSFSCGSKDGFQNLRALGHVRVYDGGAAAYGALSRGLVDVCLNGDDLDAYDICALCPIVKEAGGVITDWKGKNLSIESSGCIVASASSRLHEKTLELLQD